ncbi:MAG: tyrosine-type recombinase/integrase [Solirubrobacterales bacterium]|nr:tyrosine-type recombinase/integrase [Solirubrobacterales bacterium]
MSSSMVLVDSARRRRSPATLPGYLAGRAPRNKGMQYPPDPPRPEEIIQVMRQAGHDRHGLRIRALIAVLWRGGLRISEALALNETDIDARRGSLMIRHGKGDKRREAGMDPFGFEQLAAWLTHRVLLPPDRCSACLTAPLAAGGGRPPPPEPSYATSRSRPASGAASRLISSVMPTPWS